MNERLDYLSENDLWSDAKGNLYIKNEFDPNFPVYINVSTELWNFGSCIDWSEFFFSFDLKNALKEVLKTKLKKVSTNYIKKFAYMLRRLDLIIKTKQITFNGIDANMMLTILHSMQTTDNKILFRETYAVLAKNKILGANNSIYYKLKQLKVRDDVRKLTDVLNWHPTKGSLTFEEEKIVRNYFENINYKDANNKLTKFRLFGWLLFSTLKRCKQIRELNKDCLKFVENKGIKQHFVQVKPAKAQTGDPLRWWPIPEKLYEAMLEYSKDPKVKILQDKQNRFFTYEGNPEFEPQYFHQRLKQFCSKIISPRTNKPIVVTPLRIRHTGATRLAYSGVSRDIIAEILEHDSSSSCQSYIDAIGSELCPQINAADRNMGGFFKELNHIYFNGEIVEELNNQPISIPVVNINNPNPLFVGSCGRNTVKDGNCRKHPFIGCYNGCKSFLAWREADHRKALKYIDNEISRWKSAGLNDKAEITIKEFESVRDNILIVIASIESKSAKKEI